MNRAHICIPRTLVYEGGYSNRADDPPTNKGITLDTFRRYIKRDGTIEDLKNLTTEQAVIVYKRRYWDEVNADLLPVGVDFAVFDFGVNSGPRRGARALQAAVGARRDGIVGPATLAAVRRYVQIYGVVSLIDAICDRRLAFLRRLKKWANYGTGWTRRVEKLRAQATQDARMTHA